MLKILLLFFLITSTSLEQPNLWAASENDVRPLEKLDEPLDETAPSFPEVDTAPRNHPPVLLNPAVKPIEAQEFIVKAVKASRSGKVIMLEDPTGNDPRPGKILLLKSQGEEIVAIRVLKNYPGKFAAKIVLKFKDLALNSEYRALKKISDRIMEQIRKRESLAQEPQLTDDELAKEIDPNDVELDRGIPLPEKRKKAKTAATPDKSADEIKPQDLELKEDDLSDNLSDFSQSEDVNIEMHNHILTAQLGLMQNVDSMGDAKFYTSAGVRYGYNFARRLIFDKPTLQDMLTLEGGVFFYKIVGFSQQDDEFTVIPLSATLRYNLLVSESLTFFFYGGIVKNNASSSSTDASNSLALLSRTRAALGGGLLIRIGPGWSLRADGGTDAIAFGASLRF